MNIVQQQPTNRTADITLGGDAAPAGASQRGSAGGVTTKVGCYALPGAPLKGERAATGLDKASRLR